MKKDELCFNIKNGWNILEDKQKQKILKFSDDYIKFIDKNKTERECVDCFQNIAISKGFKPLEYYINKKKISAGDKVFYINKDKNIILAVIGSNDMENGIRIIGSHLDSPRLDLKPNPLFEDNEQALLKTHYYGGIKKYQWVTIPLSIHGVIYNSKNEKINIIIGEDDTDPAFTITDLLPHLSREQLEKKLKDSILGESLNVLVGSIPDKTGKNYSQVKANFLKILNKKYGIVEEDFQSAELEIVPAFRAKTLGLDESMVGAYGQDDKVCSFLAFKALLEVKENTKTVICILTDKEEVGSVGNTSAHTRVIEFFINELIRLNNKTSNFNSINKCYLNSEMISADVTAGLDANYSSVDDKINAIRINHGAAFNKYSGSGGKYNANDANCEFVQKIKNMFTKNNILNQTGELGKIDSGGGGTIAYILANLGMEVIDIGVPVLSMHSPFEVTSKLDIYETYRTYCEFYKM